MKVEFSAHEIIERIRSSLIEKAPLIRGFLNPIRKISKLERNLSQLMFQLLSPKEEGVEVYIGGQGGRGAWRRGNPSPSWPHQEGEESSPMGLLAHLGFRPT